MKNSRIPYVHHTFNPWWGCVPVSPGCDHCYARTLARRWGKGHCWDATAARLEMSAVYWQERPRWNAAAAERGMRERVLCGSICDVMNWLEWARVREFLEVRAA